MNAAECVNVRNSRAVTAIWSIGVLDSFSVHDSVHDFARRVVRPEHVVGKTVLEVGSYNVNGTLRPWLKWLGPSFYTGVDGRAGPGVDVVVACERLTERMGRGCWDLVVCVETLEHVTDWRLCVRELAGAVRPGGSLLLVTRTPEDGVVLAHDHWWFTPGSVREVFDLCGFTEAVVEADSEVDGVLAFGHKVVPWVASLSDVDVWKVVGERRGGCVAPPLTSYAILDA